MVQLYLKSLTPVENAFHFESSVNFPIFFFFFFFYFHPFLLSGQNDWLNSILYWQCFILTGNCQVTVSNFKLWYIYTTYNMYYIFYEIMLFMQLPLLVQPFSHFNPPLSFHQMFHQQQHHSQFYYCINLTKVWLHEFLLLYIGIEFFFSRTQWA